MRTMVETSSLSNTMKDTSTFMHNPSLHNSDKEVTHDCASILHSIAKGTSISRMVHPTSPFIQLNDFYTCIL